MAKCRTRHCSNEFVQYSTLQRLCVPCLIKKGRKIEKKTARKEHREAKERIKTKSQHQKEAQTAFNRYIRARDEYQPCISCGRYHDGQYHAGHYRTVGSHPELRFSEDNCHKQCAPCNNHKSGNIVEYRINLRKKIGGSKLIWLEGPHESKNYTIDDIKEIKAKYSKMARELEKQLITKEPI